MTRLDVVRLERLVESAPTFTRDALAPPEVDVSTERVEHTVLRVRWRDADFMKEITLSSDGPILRIPRSACVSKGDTVVLDPTGVWTACANGRAQILPLYVARERIRVGGLDLEFIIKEITEAEEFAAYQALARFHYRNHALRGRTARLVVRNFHPIYPQVVAFVELATPFYMNKARAAVLNSPFQDESVAWTTWDMAAQRRYTSLLVRIARCVVYPEFRGLGLGQVLVRHAAKFAARSWQTAGLKPIFLEISADMLKFVPFASRSGMVFVGDTEGNLRRVATDIEYLLRNRDRVRARDILKEESIGIVDTQVARMERAAALMAREGWGTAELVERLRRLSSTSALRDYDRFHEIVSLPKPTYMRGLTALAQAFVERRAQEIAPTNGHVPAAISVEPLRQPVVLDGVSVVYASQVRRTERTHAIQQAFAISPGSIAQCVVQNLSLSIGPGEVVLATGPSGSGKTTLMHLLAEHGHQGLDGAVTWPDNYRPGVFVPPRSHKALIEVLGGDVRSALHLMGLVGLSDAFVYLKRFNELSNGQQYRAMLASLITSGANLWLADEFCNNLDSLTANVVAARLQRVARQVGAALVVASSQPEAFVVALQPDRVVQLTTAWEHRVMAGGDFIRSLPNRRGRFEAPVLRLSIDYLPAVRGGHKQSTIRKGRLSFPPGPLILSAGRDFEFVKVLGCRTVAFSNLTEEDARAEGLANLATLRRTLLRHYPDLGDSNLVTVIAFERSCPLPEMICGSSLAGASDVDS